jgi:uncharacterized lipoprotein NlpE involved in copper resistance
MKKVFLALAVVTVALVACNNEEKKVEGTKIDSPVVAASKADSPVVAAPKADSPVVATPKADAPKAETPAVKGN